MNVVISGGGKLGFYLAKTLIPYKHKIKIIEKNKELCNKDSDELNLPVICGDATTISVLEKANTKEADIFIAVTGKDEANLISCQLAKNFFGVKKTIARVNNPKNVEVFEALGVDMCVSSTQLIADMIEQVVDGK